MNKKIKRRIKWKNIYILIFITTCITCLVISAIKIIQWKLDSNKTTSQIKIVQDIAQVQEIEDDETIQIIEPNQQEITTPSDPYWDYIKMNLIDVDFNQLKEINPSTIGWLQVNGTNINYPFVQTTDNKYYLTHSFDKTYNNAGWVFLDYRNNQVGKDQNTIIYAHAVNDKTMFGSLKNILTSTWLEDQNNYVLKISTEQESSIWQVFSIYRLPTTTDYLKITFKNDNEFLEFSNMLLKRSAYNFNTSINANDKILTLSTCYNNTSKVVLHAKLIKYKSN